MTNSTHIFSFEKPEDNPGFLLWQVSMQWQLRMKKGLDPLGLTLTQFVLLAALHWLSRSSEVVTQQVLAEHAKTDKMMTSKVLRTLQQKALLTRAAHQIDTRAKILQLTPAGLALLKRAVAVVEQVDKAFFFPLQGQESNFNAYMQALYTQA